MKNLGRLSSAVFALSLLGSTAAYAGSCYSHGEKSAAALMEEAKDILFVIWMQNINVIKK